MCIQITNTTNLYMSIHLANLNPAPVVTTSESGYDYNEVNERTSCKDDADKMSILLPSSIPFERDVKKR